LRKKKYGLTIKPKETKDFTAAIKLKPEETILNGNIPIKERESLKVQLFRAQRFHDHTKVLAVCKEARELIQKLLETNRRFKPKEIITQIEKANIKVPLMKDLYNYLATLKNKSLGHSNLTADFMSKATLIPKFK
jgi:hypothetical protein